MTATICPIDDDASWRDRDCKHTLLVAAAAAVAMSPVPNAAAGDDTALATCTCSQDQRSCFLRAKSAQVLMNWSNTMQAGMSTLQAPRANLIKTR